MTEKSKKIEKNVKKIDSIITDKGNIVISTKAAKYIIGLLISLNIFVFGIAWGFKVSLENKIDNILIQMDKDKKELYERITELKEKDVYNNTIKNYNQDADLRVLFDRTKINYNNFTLYYTSDSLKKLN